jgi:hypothetical protein
MGLLDTLRYKKTIPSWMVQTMNSHCDLMRLSHRLNDSTDSARVLTYYNPNHHGINTVPLRYESIKKYDWQVDDKGKRYCYVSQLSTSGSLLFEVYYLIFDFSLAFARAVEFPKDQKVYKRAVQRQLFEWPELMRSYMSKESIEANAKTHPNYAASSHSNFVS